MRRVILPSPDQIETIKEFLTDTSGLFIEGVEFGRPTSGISMRATFRDFRGSTCTKNILAPDTSDFQDVVVLMSEWLDQLSGRAQLRVLQRRARAVADG